MPEKRLSKVVLDTNIFISGLIIPKSVPGEILDLWKGNKFILITSQKILQELNKTLHYSKILKSYKIKEKIIKDLIRSIAKTSIVALEEKPVEIIREDREDNKFLSCAKSGKADFIISGDKHLLKLKSFQGIPVLKPKEFLQTLHKD